MACVCFCWTVTFKPFPDLRLLQIMACGYAFAEMIFPRSHQHRLQQTFSSCCHSPSSSSLRKKWTAVRGYSKKQVGSHSLFFFRPSSFTSTFPTKTEDIFFTPLPASSPQSHDKTFYLPPRLVSSPVLPLLQPQVSLLAPHTSTSPLPFKRPKHHQRRANTPFKRSNFYFLFVRAGNFGIVPFPIMWEENVRLHLCTQVYIDCE